MSRNRNWMVGVPLAVALGAIVAHADDAPKGRLAVVIVIDQFRADFLTRFKDLFDPREGAFLRLEREGATFTSAHYEHATTYTGPGHAHVLTGGFAYRTGMVGNRWFDRKSQKVMAICGDATAHVVGGPGDEKEGTSPRNLIGTTLGDELILGSGGRSRVVSIALKARSSILLGGKLGKSYWFNEKTGGFATSTYYSQELPAWVASFNRERPADRWFGAKWEPCVPEGAFERASADDEPFEGDLVGLGRTFPHPITGKLSKPGEDYYDAVSKTPFGTDLELDFAKVAIESQELGVRGGTDLIAISLSSNDEIGHTFGPFSREVLDATVRTDRQLGAFLRWLDAKRPGYTLVLTADHGASPLPEQMARLGVEAHRIKKKQLEEAVTKELNARFGEAKWVVALEDPSVYLDLAVIAERKLDRAEVETVAARALEKVPGIAGTFTRGQLLRGDASTALARSYQICFNPDRSGDVLIVPAPYSFWGKYAEKDYGDSHGSPYSYDTHVPLAFLGAGVRSGVHAETVSIADLAPTLGAMLGVGAPPCSEGRVLSGVVGR